MKKQSIIKLKIKEKKELNSLIKKGSESARKLTRCRILLLVDKGQRKKLISEALSVDPNTIQNICKRYLKEGLESSINEKPRPGAPIIFSGKFKASLTALACSKAPEGYSKWSLRLLADKVVELKYVDSISHTEVGRILKKTK